MERPRERVLEAAWELLVERGLADLTLAELGRRLDTSAGHLLYYFGSKDGLLLAVLRWSEQELAQERAKILRSRAAPQTRLKRFCDLFLPQHAGDPRWLLWIELWPRVLRDPELRMAGQALDRAWEDDLAALLEATGHTADHAAALAQRAVAMLDGFSVQLVNGTPGLTRARVWAHVRALLEPPAP